MIQITWVIILIVMRMRIFPIAPAGNGIGEYTETAAITI
jgi:hypothetical protein